MNFEFSAEQLELRNQARRFFSDRCPTTSVKAIMDSPAHYDAELWQGMAEMGLFGINIPEQFGGLGLGYLELCVVAEEIGRAVAPVPYSSTIYLASELLLLAGSNEQKTRWLPQVATGESIGTLAVAEQAGAVTPAKIECTVSNGLLSGNKCIVADGNIADFALVAASDNGAISLYLVDMSQDGIDKSEVETIDPTRNHCALQFTNVNAELLGEAGQGWSYLQRVYDKAAVLIAFEQVGGAETAIYMGRDYAQDRMAFGRPIGSFQAIKHMLADMFVAMTLARSNAYYGAWALSNDAEELPQAAATARVSATKAYQLCAMNNIQVHGGMGFTWELDCHLHYRRSNLLALTLGTQGEWENKLIDRLAAAA